MRRVQLILLCVGVALFVFVVTDVGVSAIVEGLRRIGWAFVAIAAIELTIDAIHSEGWRYCLPPSERSVSRWDIFLTRTAGFAVNVLTPTATVGGEVVKGLVIRRWVPTPDAFASVLLDKLTFAVGQAVFLVAGLAAVFGNVPFSPQERGYALIAFGLWLGGVAAFFLLQRAGILRVGIGVMRTLFGASALVDQLPDSAGSFDEKIQDFFGRYRGAFAASIGLHVLGQSARALQFYIALSALGFAPTLEASLTTAAGLVFVEATMFLVPARLGVLEQAHVLIFSTLGYGAAAGLTVAFTMRLSELCSALVGLAALGYFHLRPDEVRAEGDHSPDTAARRSQNL